MKSVLFVMINLFVGIVMAQEALRFDDVHTFKSTQDGIIAGINIKHSIDDSRYFKGAMHFLEHLILHDNGDSEFHKSLRGSEGDFNGLTTPGAMLIYFKSSSSESLRLLFEKLHQPDFSIGAIRYELGRWLKEVDEKTDAMLQTEVFHASLDNFVSGHSIGSRDEVEALDIEAIRENMMALHSELMANARFELIVAKSNGAEGFNDLKKDIPTQIYGRPYLLKTKASGKKQKKSKPETIYLDVKHECILHDEHLDYFSEKLSALTGRFSYIISLYSTGGHTLYELYMDGGVEEHWGHALVLPEGVTFDRKDPPFVVNNMSDIKLIALSNTSSTLPWCGTSELNEWVEKVRKANSLSL